MVAIYFPCAPGSSIMKYAMMFYITLPILLKISSRLFERIQQVILFLNILIKMFDLL